MKNTDSLVKDTISSNYVIYDKNKELPEVS